MSAFTVPPMCGDRPIRREQRDYGESPLWYAVCPAKVTNPVYEFPCTGSVHVGTTEVLCPCACHKAPPPRPERRAVWWQRPEWVQRWLPPTEGGSDA